MKRPNIKINECSKKREKGSACRIAAKFNYLKRSPDFLHKAFI